MNRGGLLLVVLSGLFLFSGCAIVHRYGPYMGQVIDVETGEAIEGAAVLAVYNTRSYTVGGPNSHFLDTQETVTDSGGRFMVPPMTSFTFRPLQTFEPWAWITVFKPGYAGYGCSLRHEDVEPRKFPFPPDKSVVIKLPRLMNRDERLEYCRCYPYAELPARKYPILFHLLQQERVYLGFDPIVPRE